MTITYDALGRMVEQDKSGIYTQIVYDPSGDKLGVMSTTSTLKEAFAALPGGAKAAYNSSGLQLYWHADWLGSWRLSSTPTRSLNSERFYAPYGEQYPSYGSVLTASFAGNDEDTGADLYDAAYREYEIFGRWPSPDPGGTAAANPANPQSWNRYAYVLNNPLLLMDTRGLLPPGSCYRVQAKPTDNSQQAFGGPSAGDFDLEFEPPQSGCGADTPFGGGSGDDTVGVDFGMGPSSLCTSAGCFVCPNNSCSAPNGQEYQCNAANHCYVPQYSRDIQFVCSSGPDSDASNCQMTHDWLQWVGDSGQSGYWPVFGDQLGPATSDQLTAAVAEGTSLAGHAIPAVCGAGGFLYAGGGHFYGSIQADTGSGLSAGGFFEGNVSKNLGGGLGGTMTSSGPEPDAFIFLGEDAGVLLAPSTTPSVGGFFGGGLPGTNLHAGGGAYVTIGPASCN